MFMTYHGTRTACVPGQIPICGLGYNPNLRSIRYIKNTRRKLPPKFIAEMRELFGE